jgi:hypothetical protein
MSPTTTAAAARPYSLPPGCSLASGSTRKGHPMKWTTKTRPELRVERAELVTALRRLEQTDEGQVLTRLQRLAVRLLSPRPCPGCGICGRWQ